MPHMTKKAFSDLQPLCMSHKLTQCLGAMAKDEMEVYSYEDTHTYFRYKQGSQYVRHDCKRTNESEWC